VKVVVSFASNMKTKMHTSRREWD